jgi:hypothetical protein
MPSAITEKAPYVLAFGVIASLLLIVEFPTFVIFFFGVFAYFLWKIFSSASRNETREIFEFYLAANDILRDDERKWFGFEMKEVVGRGESIVKNMSGAPPLVYFALGALYNKMGDHSAASNHLSYVVENESADERAFVYPSPELRNYVRILRKIEREPAEAPLTSSAVRALERARKNRARILLENSRELQKLAESAAPKEPQVSPLQEHGVVDKPLLVDASNGHERYTERTGTVVDDPDNSARTKEKEKSGDENPFADRKSISEVLHDIYDRNIQ